MPKKLRLACMLAAVVAGSSPLVAQADESAAGAGPGGTIEVSDAWARSTSPAARNGAAYMTVSNHGAASDRLLSAATEVAERAELHEHLMQDGVAVMRQVTAVEVESGGEVSFRPGGLHVMLMSLDAPLSVGDSFEVTLSFAEAGAITVEVPVHRSDPHGHEHEGEADSHDAGGHSH